MTTLHGPNRKHSFQQFLYCFLCICCRGNLFTEPLPSNKRLLWLHYSGLHASCHNLIFSLKYALRMRTRVLPTCSGYVLTNSALVVWYQRFGGKCYVCHQGINVVFWDPVHRYRCFGGKCWLHLKCCYKGFSRAYCLVLLGRIVVFWDANIVQFGKCEEIFRRNIGTTWGILDPPTPLRW
jgi:hypothetical protein